MLYTIKIKRMIKKRYSSTERIGVNKVEQIFLELFNWIFREQPIVDMGIDAQVEFVDDNPTGKLIALQIKTGSSHFYQKENSYTYYIKEAHYQYWTHHSLPVIIIAHLPEENLTVWEYVSNKNIDKTSEGWKIEIPKKNNLEDESSIYQISEIIKSKSLDGKVTRLKLDAVLMKHIVNGGKVNVHTQEWHNKSLGRGPFEIILIDEYGEEETAKQWSSFYTLRLEELLQKYFPWAETEVDEEFYENNFDKSFYDVYTDEYIESHSVYPFKVLEGEVSEYRLNLKLNKIGKAYLDLKDYLDE